MKWRYVVRCAALLALLGLLGVGAAQADDAAVVKIARLAGTVEVMHKDATHGKWIDAEVDQELSAGWSLRTGDESKAQLVFPKDNVVILKEHSVLIVHEVTAAGGAHIESTDGGLLVQLKNHLDPGSEFTLDTPDAQAIVRGTEYGVQIEDAGQDEHGQPLKRATFYGYDGRVEVKNSKGSQYLEHGKTLVAELGKIGIPFASLAVANDFLNDLNSQVLYNKAKGQAQKQVDKQINKARKKLKF